MSRLKVKAVRTAFLDYDARREPKTGRFCIRCQRDIKADVPARVVRIIPGEPMILHPDDAGTHGVDALIGLECAEIVGLEFSRPETSSESVVPRTKRTHIDHLLDRKGITKAQHRVLKAAELAHQETVENAARELTYQVISKAKE